VVSGALILIGAPGAGKSAVLDALSTRLEIERVPFGAIETEELGRGWPWLGARDWLPELAAIVALQREAGRDTFLVVATTETEEELRGVVDAVAAERTVVVCLSAPGAVTAARVAEREPDTWPGKAALVAHSRTLAQAIPSLPGIDVVIPTDGRDVDSVVAEVLGVLDAQGVIRHAAR
jgi:hypothetical protein